MGTQFTVKYFAEKKLNVGAYISLAGPGNILEMRPEIGEKIKLFRPVAQQYALVKKSIMSLKNCLLKSFHSIPIMTFSLLKRI